MSIAQWGESILSFVRGHEAWAGPICFGLAFGESFAFVSFVLPATVVLIGLGGLVGQAGLEFWPVMIGAALGAALGDWASFWLGHRFEAQIVRMWPLSTHPELVARGRAFVERWGAPGVFLGRFLGPLRATVPLIAGFCAMSSVRFQIANWLSAFVWAFVVLAPGAFGIGALRDWFA